MRNCKPMLSVLGLVLAFAVAGAAGDAPLTFKFTAINIPGAAQVFPGGVNDSGVMVGAYLDTSGVYHGFMLKGKTVTTIDDPKGTNNICKNISPKGAAIVGYYLNASDYSVSFLFKNNKFTAIPGPKGAVSTQAYGINDAGEIVGEFLDSNFLAHGFLLKGGKYTTLNVPTAVITEATGINDSGTIVLYWEN